LLRKRAPQKTLHFTWTIRERNTLCWNFQQPGVIIVPQEDVECVSRTKSVWILGGVNKSVVFFYVLGNVMLGTLLSEHSRMSPEDISDSCVSWFMSKPFQYFDSQWMLKSTLTLKKAVQSI
jgi:hypothetical protein